MTLESLRGWAGEHLPPYSVPRTLRTLPFIPRNAMGKVDKRALAKQVFGGQPPP